MLRSAIESAVMYLLGHCVPIAAPVILVWEHWFDHWVARFCWIYCTWTGCPVAHSTLWYGRIPMPCLCLSGLCLIIFLLVCLSRCVLNSMSVFILLSVSSVSLSSLHLFVLSPWLLVHIIFLLTFWQAGVLCSVSSNNLTHLMNTYSHMMKLEAQNSS